MMNRVLLTLVAAAPLAFAQPPNNAAPLLAALAIACGH